LDVHLLQRFVHVQDMRGTLLNQFGPGGGVFFAGTYNGHPVGVAAALATIAALEDGTVHKRCFTLARRAADGLRRIAAELGIPITVALFGSVFVPYFMEERSCFAYQIK
jgi:glutamate-1-semialdehyde 2,1-aminomutase